ncbi:MAG: S16 family serine protease [Candidatus Diapherotrites archaeon]
MILRKVLFAFAIFSLLLLIAHPAIAAAVTKGEMKIYAVTTEGKGLSSSLVVEIVPGTGKVWSSVEPLVGTTTQNTERIAVELAKNYSKEVNSHDYKFTINSDASVVEGPSAGAAMALLVISMLEGRQLPANVSVTGTITRDGRIGGVGGVFEKARAASESGIKLFLVPQGEAKQTVKLDGNVQSVNLLEYAPQAWGLKVVEVETIDDVLKYAFSDIGSIDVNVSPSAGIVDFVPVPVNYAENAAPMKQLTSRYLQETREMINVARNSLSTTLLEDNALVNGLLESLKGSEEALHMAEILNDQNYLYSAANYSFLARANAMLVKDISDNPSLLNDNSTAFELKIFDLKGKVSSLREALDSYVPVDYLEWHISAQQRLAYAELNLQKLTGTQTIVIGGDEDAATSLALQNLQDYEFALAWYGVANDFYQVSRVSKKKVVPGDEFRTSMDELIVAAENALAASGKSDADAEEILRRLNAAKYEKGQGWYLASVFDAASAYALLVSEQASADKDAAGLQATLSQMISALDKNMAASSNAFLWPRLYLDHAKYYYASAEFYADKSQNISASASLKNGISLAFLAGQLFNASDSILSYYSALPGSEYIIEKPVTAGEVGQPQQPQDNTLLIAGVCAAVLALVISLLLVLRLRAAAAAPPPLGSEISRLKELQRKADEAFMKGKMGEEKHTALVKGYRTEIAELGGLRRTQGMHTLELDRLKSEVVAFTLRLRELRQHFNDGILTKKEYGRTMQEYGKHISELQNGIEKEIRFLDGVKSAGKKLSKRT